MDQEKARYARHARIKGLLTSVVEELPDVPLYYWLVMMHLVVRHLVMLLL